MNTETAGTGPRPQAIAYSGPVADPRPLAIAAQVLIATETAVQVAVGLTTGPGSALRADLVPVSFPLFVSTIAVFLWWFRRCRLNADLLAPGTHRYSEGFAVGGWFIPLGMWWIPRRTALDIWRASGPADGAWLVDAWWVAWLAKTVGAAVVMRFESRPDGYTPYDMVAGVVAAVLAILVIRQITARQDARVRADLAASPFTRGATA